MCKKEDLNTRIDEKLASLRFVCDNNSHIKLKSEVCRSCKGKECLNFCPAEVYKLQENGEDIEVEFENCLECGTCRLSCPFSAVDWQYPKDSSGATFKFG